MNDFIAAKLAAHFVRWACGIWMQVLFALAAAELWVLIPIELLAQDANIAPAAATDQSESADRDRAIGANGGNGQADQGNRELLLEQIGKLSSPSYRAREMAMWQLQQRPSLAIELISERLPTSDLNTGTQLIDMLSKFAMQPEMTIGIAAIKVLENVARENVSFLSQQAQKSLQAIADMQEVQAIDILTHLGAEISFPRLTINGMEQNLSGSQLRIMRLDARFVGTAADTLRFRFLQHVEAVFIHQIRVDASLVKAISQMPKLRMVVLSKLEISATDLRHFQAMKNLDHFELSYVPIGDEVLPVLENLPVWGSMRLYGTNISRAGAEEIKQKLDGLSIYIGRGGFLGIATFPANLTITKVQPDSAAALAGLRINDKVTHINSVPIKTFEDLREQLAYYAAHDKIRVQFQRDGKTESSEVELGELQVPISDP